MPTLYTWLRQPIQIAQTVMMIAAQVMHWVRRHLYARMALAAETLFLKRQLARMALP
jgi:hypothetical protein